MEQQKRKKHAKETLCDVHALGVGLEAPDRFQTKLFGRPARPASLPWPVDREGQPYEFVCQFNFIQSKDILSSLPGDLLLVFARSTPICNSNDPDELLFEWLQLPSATQLAGPECDEHLVRKMCFWGQPLRIFDFDSIQEISEITNDLFAEVTDVLMPALFHVEHDPGSTGRCRGLKIAGIPSWGPNGGPGEWGSGIEISNGFLEECIYLGGFGQIDPPLHLADPFINIQEPFLEYSDQHSLFWYDGFQYHFFWHNALGVQWVIDYL